jgi:hypothetical protein
MTTIKKFKEAPSAFIRYFPEGSKTYTLNHILNITEDLLQYKLTRTKTGEEETDVILQNFELSLDVLKSHNRFYDHSYWTVKTDEFNPDVTYRQPLVKQQLLNIFELSFPTKASPLIDYNVDIDYVQPLRFFVPSENSKFTDCTFLVLGAEDLTPSETISDVWNITTTVEVNTPNTFENSYANIREIFGTISSNTSLSTVSAGTTIPVIVTCSDTLVSKLYLEQVTGVLDRLTVDMVNGTGTFNILTDTLTSGDVVKVKIGYKKFSNLNTFTKTIA